MLSVACQMIGCSYSSSFSSLALTIASVRLRSSLLPAAPTGDVLDGDMRCFAPGRVDVIDVPVAAGRHRLVHHRDVDHEGLARSDRALEGGLEVLRGADLLALRAVGTRNGGEVRRVRLAVLAKDAAERRSVVRHLEPGDGAKGVVVHDDPNHRNV